MSAAWSAVLAIAVCTAPASAQAGPADEVRRSELVRFAAMMKGDTAAVAPLLAAELTYTHSNALVESKADHLSAIGSKRTIYRSVTPVEFGYRPYGDLVVGAGVVRTAGVLAGVDFDVTLRVTTVHVRREGRWQLVAWQSTRMP
ncbi:MAG: nuclear transport factor 2 family protein [Gemmatimonadales bacterium]|nr:nuclear transport factor 2 family protein [Gemmatimonadales bacterium]